MLTSIKVVIGWLGSNTIRPQQKADLYNFFPPLFGAEHNDDAPADDLVQLSDSDVNKATYKWRISFAGQAQ